MNLGHKESMTELRERRCLTQEIADYMGEPQFWRHPLSPNACRDSS
jgi:hypothetical protein